MLIIKRASGWGDSLRNYKVILDGKEIGKIADGETCKYNVVPGEHTLCLKIDYGRSKKIPFNAAKGEDIQFVCGPNITGLKILAFPLYLTVLCARYIRLEHTS